MIYPHAIDVDVVALCVPVIFPPGVTVSVQLIRPNKV